MRIHQFHSGSACGDAVTNSMLLLQRHLHSLGFESRVFVEHLDPRLADRLSPLDELDNALAPEDLLIVRHSMGHDQLDRVLAMPARRVLMYHNITPAEFFPPGSVLRHYAELGRRQLTLLRGAVEGALADSEFNAAELRDHGFKDVDVLPILVDDTKFADLLRPRCLEQGTGRPWTVLFVGRVCQNKGHGDLIEVAHYWAERYRAFPVQFVCVGNADEDDPFFVELQQRIVDYGIDHMFRFAGKVNDDELKDWYATADCYLSLSSHEGFGVPLVEAMLSDLPVVALARSAVPETLGGAGLLLDEADPECVAAALLRLMRNRGLRQMLVTRQRERASAFASCGIREGVLRFLERIGIVAPGRVGEAPASSTPIVRIDGPYDSSYSLASVNRELAKSLERNGLDVRLFSTEGPGDFVPAEGALQALDAQIREIAERNPGVGAPSFAVRNLYPPRVRDLRANTGAGYFFWEESAFPAEYVRDFNLSLDVLLAPSHFVSDVWRSSGVNVPVRYIGAGADHILKAKPEPIPDLPGAFRFLHVSSCFPRKGPDVLLKAFGRAFTGRTDVVLVIKTFANPHNDVARLLAELRVADPEYPPVVVLDEDYSPGQVRSLYLACDAYVAPSRGEGFGLPMAEAMLHDMPVITTGWGGHRDFCRESTAHLIRYQLAASSSHVGGCGMSLWAEPEIDHLVQLLRRVRDQSPDHARIRDARALVEREFSWDRVAQRLRSVVEETSPQRDFSVEPLRLAWVSTWNEACGVATYSRYLLENLPPGEVDLVVHGRRETSSPDSIATPTGLWKDASEPLLIALRDRIIEDRAEVVVVQFNFGFFSVEALATLVSDLDDHGIQVILVMHSTADVDRPDFKASLRSGKSGLSRAARILVHSVEDLQRMHRFGLGARAALFPHGAMEVAVEGRDRARQRLEIEGGAKIIASYGFMLPHKGLTELVDAFARLRADGHDAWLFMVNAEYPADVSRDLHRDLLDRMHRHGIRDRVRMFTDFLPERTSLALLEAADLVVFPYQQTAESASGAVRFGLAAQRPVATTPLAIFSDLGDVGLRFRGCTPDELAVDLAAWLCDANLDRVITAQASWTAERSWPKLMLRLVDLARGLVLDRYAPGSLPYEPTNTDA